MKTGLILIFSIFFLVNQLFSQAETALLKAVNYEDFYKHIEFLADDELKGRDTGSEGYAMAAEYVKDEFKSLKLQSLFDDGSYFQNIPLKRTSIAKASFELSFTEGEEIVDGIYGENITILTGSGANSLSFESDLVFVGYGNIIPEEEIDDYANLDVEGKTVLIALGAPKSVKKGQSMWSKISTASEKGASGVILFSAKGIGQKMIYRQFHGWLARPRMSIADTVFTKSSFDIEFGAFATKDLIESVLEQEGLKLKKQLKLMKKSKFEGIQLKSEIACNYEIINEEINCKNVLAVMPGSDPELKDEYILLSAHLDHVGVGRPVKGDSIYNGMWDNATGSAAVMNIAKAYRDAGIEPKRSIIFACYTGEEKGLFGSKYLAEYNPLDSGQIITNINIDMLGGLVETTDFTPLGYSHSNVSESADFAAETLGLSINDPVKAERLYLHRSDQVSFIKKGIPAIYLNNGETPKNKGDKPEKITEKWMKKTYHSPKDDLEQEFSPEAFLTGLKVNALITYHLTNVIEKVAWNTEEWIYKRYVAKE